MIVKNQIPVAAHRGNSSEYPENTIPAFRSAIDLQVDMIELDVQMTKDREVVVMHDHRVNRTTNGDGLVSEFCLEQLKSLDAGTWKEKRFAGVRVPTFSEVLELAGGREDLLFNVELKDYPHLTGDWAYESAEKTISLLERYGIAQRSVINCWSGELLEYIDEKYRHRYKLHGYYPYHLMGQNQKKFPLDYLYCICLFSESEDPVVGKSVFDEVKKNGVQPWVYLRTEEADEYRRAVENGAMLFTANNPARAMKILKRYEAASVAKTRSDFEKG